MSNNCAYVGGGSFNASLQSCTLTGNSAASGRGVANGNAFGCVLIGNSAQIGGAMYGGGHANCTIISNYASIAGGGVSDSVVDHCTFIGNSAPSATGLGGAAYVGTYNACSFFSNWAAFGGAVCGVQLSNCLIVSNSSAYGGGVSDDSSSAIPSTLTNCTLVANSATVTGGGALNATLKNTIIFYNTAPDGPDCSMCSLLYCYTPLISSGGSGNITADPLFVKQRTGDFHLQAGSPCCKSEGIGSAGMRTTAIST